MTTPISPKGDPVERGWQQALAAGPDCLPIDRLDAELTPAERTHVAGCARCQTELEMFAAYEADESLAGEGLSVAWIAQRARRAVQDGAAVPQAVPASVPAPAVTAPAAKVTWGVPRWALAAASVAVILGGTALVWRPAPAVDSAAPGEVYRATRLEITAPVGDIPTPPAAMAFTAVPGAVEYEVRLFEVDGTELWRVTTPSPAVPVPTDVSAAALPAKTLVWQVVARDAQQRVLAESGDVRFRVQPR